MSNPNDLAREIAEMRRASRRQNLKESAHLAALVAAGAAGALVGLYFKDLGHAVKYALFATATVAQLQALLTMRRQRKSGPDIGQAWSSASSGSAAPGASRGARRRTR